MKNDEEKDIYEAELRRIMDSIDRYEQAEPDDVLIPMKQSGWVKPDGSFLSNEGTSHGEILRLAKIDIIPDNALYYGFLWVLADEDALEIECSAHRLDFAKRWGNRWREPGQKVRISVQYKRKSTKEIWLE